MGKGKRKADYTQERKGYLKRVKNLKKPPSALADPDTFNKEQKPQDPLILNGRPNDATGLPVALTHPIFGRFSENLYHIEPDKHTAEMVLQLRKATCSFTDNDDGYRCNQLLEIINDYTGRRFAPYYFGNRRHTDGSLVQRRGNREIPMASIEKKRELGVGGGCPYLQSSAYYIEFIRKFEADVVRHTRLPMFLLCITGPYVSISGGAFLGLPVVEPLTPMMPLHCMSDNEGLMTTTIRMFRAFKIALDELDLYYKQLMPSPLPLVTPSRPASPQNIAREYQHKQLTFPYVDRVKIGGADVEVTYTGKIHDGRHIFKGRVAGRDVVIKFARRYSRDCHERCHKLGIAPELLACERLPGGWFVAVMEWLRDYKTLEQCKCTRNMEKVVRKAVKKMHDAGIVHGDLRTPNIMIGPQESVMLIDFDWAGEKQEAKYPPFMNPNVDWHPDADYGCEILTQHDEFLLNAELELKLK